MEEKVTGHASFKQKALHELKMYWLIALYFMAFLGAFTLYRRLILAEVGASYLSYGFKVVEALIVAKVILIGEAIGIGKRFENRPLIASVAVKSLLFGVFIVAFNILEHVVEALIHKTDVRSALLERGLDEMLARTLVLMIALIPLFAFLEIARVLGPGRMSSLFFSSAGRKA